MAASGGGAGGGPSRASGCVATGGSRPVQAGAPCCRPTADVVSVSTIDIVNLWEPTILGKNQLNGQWWAYLVRAPFAMPSDAPELMGTRVVLDGAAFGIGGSIPNVPARPIAEGDPIQILVSAL